ncbi:MAG: RecX family transcriptional regulator [Synergistaceae bacterium]|nr:RecX family transcriptional regulator [Synergistaceae bacterium]
MSELREKFMNAMLKRPSTRKQAREFLVRSHAGEEEIASLMSEAEEMGLIDDEAFARLFVDGHLRWGNLKIAYELGMRGLCREDIEEALDEAEDEVERAREIAAGWRKSGIEERKIASRLAGRGFTSRAVRSAMSGN